MLLAMTGLSRTATEEIRAEMARQRISQHTLAEQLGWTQGYLSRRLTGEVSLSLDDVDAIAAALGISTVQLVWPRENAKGAG